MMSVKRTNTLLLLDDDPNVLSALRRELASDHYQIHAFTRPFDALQLLKSAPVDVIVSDLCMPQMDGHEFLRRATAAQPEAVLIALSGYVEEDRGLEQAAAPTWKTLEKPWSSQELRQTVAEAFGCSI